MRRLLLLALLGIAAGTACWSGAAPPPRAHADPALLFAALAGWSEGPTDGRLCLDPAVLPDSGAPSSAPVLWSDPVLSVLLADPALALDTTRAPRPDGRGRACAPTSAGPRISVSVPRLRGDSADVVTTAWAPLPRGHPAARALRFPATLAQRGGRWEIVARPGRGFRVLRPAG